jgi:hypothetical protein
VEEGFLAVISLLRNVVRRAGRNHASTAWHGRQSRPTSTAVSKLSLSPFRFPSCHVFPLTIAWEGGDPNGTVVLSVYGATDNTYQNGSLARCRVPVSARSFTIPPYVLLPLPSTNFAGLNVGIAQSAGSFTATGLDFGSVHTESVGTGASSTCGRERGHEP